jgi:hypothetical protein
MAEPIEQRVRTLAVHSVGRGCFFAALAIWCVMIGLIADPLQSLKSGAILTMIVACVLLLKAGYVTNASYKKTEVWIMLGRRIELSPEVAQRIITVALREVYLRYALYAAAIAIAFWFCALLFWLFGARGWWVGASGAPSMAARAVDSLIGWWAGP